MGTDIIEISAGLIHPSILARQHLHRFLVSKIGCNVKRMRSMEGLNGLNMDHYSAVVIYLHRQKISPPALRQLKNFVANGGGLLALHSATASFKQVDDYFDIIGGRFTKHDRIKSFQIIPSIKNDPVFGKIKGFSIHDELYIHECKNDLTVHFHAACENKTIPMVWTRNYKKGRVCYISPGHCSGSIKHPKIEVIIKKGLEWVCC